MVPDKLCWRLRLCIALATTSLQLLSGGLFRMVGLRGGPELTFVESTGSSTLGTSSGWSILPRASTKCSEHTRVWFFRGNYKFTLPIYGSTASIWPYSSEADYSSWGDFLSQNDWYNPVLHKSWPWCLHKSSQVYGQFFPNNALVLPAVNFIYQTW